MYKAIYENKTEVLFDIAGGEKSALEYAKTLESGYGDLLELEHTIINKRYVIRITDKTIGILDYWLIYDKKEYDDFINDPKNLAYYSGCKIELLDKNDHTVLKTN